MHKFSIWFFENGILPHFKAEEKYIFPVVGKDHELIKRALKGHRRIKRLFRDTKNPEKSLSLLEEALKAHIRFEERVLFNEFQRQASPEHLLSP